MRFTTRRFVSLFVALAATAFGGIVVAAVPADAANGCSGTLQETQPIKAGTTPIGSVQLYWNSSAGTNCVTTVHAGPTAGVQSWTYTEVDVCATNLISSCGVADKVYLAQGPYSYYAWENSGPSAHHCVSASGSIDYAGHTWSASIDPGHCV